MRGPTVRLEVPWSRDLFTLPAEENTRTGFLLPSSTIDRSTPLPPDLPPTDCQHRPSTLHCRHPRTPGLTDGLPLQVAVSHLLLVVCPQHSPSGYGVAKLKGTTRRAVVPLYVSFTLLFADSLFFRSYSLSFHGLTRNMPTSDVL